MHEILTKLGPRQLRKGFSEEGLQTKGEEGVRAYTVIKLQKVINMGFISVQAREEVGGGGERGGV